MSSAPTTIQCTEMWTDLPAFSASDADRLTSASVTGGAALDPAVPSAA